MPETLPATHNSSGFNGATNSLPDFPYSMRFAKAKVMLELGKTYDEIQSATGLCRESIHRVRTGEKQIEEGLQVAMRKMEANKFTLLLHEITDSIDGRTIEKASLLQRVVSVGTLLDKRELLEGRPTQRTAFAGQKDEALDAEIQALQEKLGAWEQGKVINAVTLPVEIESVDGHKD